VQGRADRLGHKLPADIRLTQAPPGAELGDLLERGEIDFLMTANNPLSFRRGSPTVRRLFPNYMELEKDYYRRTKIYPIMHTLVIRREIYERDPWVALSLYKAFVRAKEYSFRLLLETGSPKASFAWLQPMIEQEQAIIGKDWYPYGIEANRPTIEALLQYTMEYDWWTQARGRGLFAPSPLRVIPLAEHLAVADLGPAIRVLHNSDTGDETGARPPFREGKHLDQKFDHFMGENFWTRLVSPTSPVYRLPLESINATWSRPKAPPSRPGRPILCTT
jgi:hypothetical protein